MVQRRETDSTNQVVVVGAGVAGVLIARALAERDLAVTVVDPAPPAAAQEPARQGALYVKPAVDYSPETQFAHLAFLHAADFYSRLQAQHPTHAFWHQTGTLQLAWNERERKRQEKLIARNNYGPDFLRAVSAGTASKLSGIDLLQGGLWFPRGGHLLHSGLLCAALDHPRIRCAEPAAQ